MTGWSLSGAARPKDCRVTTLPGILRKIETNIRIEVFFRIYVRVKVKFTL
jgi:hypothetical protein